MQKITTTPELREAWVERRGYWRGFTDALASIGEFGVADGRHEAYVIGMDALNQGAGNQLPWMLRREREASVLRRDGATDQADKSWAHATCEELGKMIAEADVVDAHRTPWA